MTDVVTGAPPLDPQAERLAELRSSARGWHGVQLAVIGFIGLCGVLTGDGSGGPRWVAMMATYMALAALALACLATYQIGRAAWPLYDVRRAAPPVAEELLRTSRRITSGLALTFVAVALVALAGASSWWPAGDTDDGAAVELEGTAICGTLVPAEGGGVAVLTGDEPIRVPSAQVGALRPVDGC